MDVDHFLLRIIVIEQKWIQCYEKVVGYFQ